MANSFWSGGEFLAKSEAETQALGSRVAAELECPALLILTGPLGAGKTRFVAGLAAGLGCESPVSSPSFSLVHEYHGGRVPLVHCDFYRLGGTEEVWSIGWEDLLPDNLVVVEWGEKFADLFPAGTRQVIFSITPSNERILCPLLWKDADRA